MRRFSAARATTGRSTIATGRATRVKPLRSRARVISCGVARRTKRANVVDSQRLHHHHRHHGVGDG